MATAPMTTGEKIAEAAKIVGTAIPDAPQTKAEQTTAHAVSVAAKVAEIAAPQYADEIKLAKELEPIAFHAGRLIAHFIQHLFGRGHGHGHK